LKNQTFTDSKGVKIVVIEPGGYRDQKSCGSCYAFAISSVLGDRYALKYKINNPYLSPAWIISSYSNPGFSKDPKCDTGANVQSVCKWIEKDGNGIKKEICWPYSILKEVSEDKYVPPDPLNDTNIIPNDCCAACCSDSIDHKQIFYSIPNSTNYIVATTNGIFNTNPDATIKMIQTEIITNGPVVSSFSIYKDFYEYWNNRAGSKNFSDKKIYNTYGDIYIRDITTVDSSTGKILGLVEDGGHAVVITGWGIQKDGVQKGIKYWEVRNSWGKSGDNGYCKIAFSSSVPKETWVQIDIPQYNLGVSLSGGCISFLPGDLPTETNNYGKTNTSNFTNPIGYVDYPPIFAPINLPNTIPEYLKPVIRYIVISLIAIVILFYYYYFFKILLSKNVHINLILKIFIILLGLGFAAAYAIIGIKEHNFYGLFTYINNYL
jgi:hypothetical protein